MTRGKHEETPPLRDWQNCEHSGFYTLAEVPGGFYCEKCQQIIWRHICLRTEPQDIGYTTANWAWHYRDGKPWTDDAPDVNPNPKSKSLKSMSARPASPNPQFWILNTPVREIAPVALTVHPVLDNHPQWDDESPEFAAFCRDIAEFGIDHPILTDSKNRIVDGRQRWRAAKRLKLETVRVQTVPENNLPRLVVHFILARRHYSKGALTYMSLPLIEESYLNNSKSFEQVVVQEFGFTLSTVKQARQVREIFREGDLGEEYRQLVEPDLLAGDISLGHILAGWGGFKSTRKVKKRQTSPLDLWNRSFNDLQKRFTTWDKFDSETKATVAARLTPLVESMPAELLAKFRDRIAAELKHRKEDK
jgi:hypothetical protein